MSQQSQGLAYIVEKSTNSIPTMIAFLEPLLQENRNTAEPTTTATANDESCEEPTNRDMAHALRSLNLLDYNMDPSHPSYSHDFGGVEHSPPFAVLRPTSSSEVSRAIKLTLTSPSLTLAPRGNGHSISGQAMAPVVLDTSGLNSIKIDISKSLAWVGAGSLWEDVLKVAVWTCQKAPRSWTDYLSLTVGGTLSVGGVSGQAFKHGPQTSNVKELEVVTGGSDVVICSESRNSDLFFAVLGGLGQFGVITRALLPLFPAPDMVRWMRFIYVDFEEYAADAESLVSRDDTFDYIEGFAFVNSDDPVNGWDAVPLSPDQGFDRDRIPPGSGPVLYCLELVLHYNVAKQKSSIEEKVTNLLSGLRYVRGLEFTADVEYVEFLTRVKRAEEAARNNGTWDAPHPWLNIFVSSANIVDFDLNVFKKILSKGIGGPMLVYPLLKSKWDPRTSLAVPESEIFYLVALLRFGRPFPAGRPVEELIAENQQIIDHCVSSGYDFKIYIPHCKNEDQWKQHFGNKWSRFVERKRQYDPTAILAPGQRIFSRVNGPA